MLPEDNISLFPRGLVLHTATSYGIVFSRGLVLHPAIIKKFQSLKVRWYLQYKLLLEHLKNDDFVRLLHTCTHPTGFVIVSYSPTGPHYQCHGGHPAPAPYTSTRFHSGSLYIGTALEGPRPPAHYGPGAGGPPGPSRGTSENGLIYGSEVTNLKHACL